MMAMQATITHHATNRIITQRSARELHENDVCTLPDIPDLVFRERRAIRWDAECIN